MSRNQERVTLGIILLAILACSVLIILIVFLNTPTIEAPLVQFSNSQAYSQELSEALNKFTVNINKATKQRLEELPEVGATLAQRIIDYRDNNGDFDSIEELLEIKGIGEATLERLRPYIFIE